jgi:sugar/nucleoside kinase (ribokinase family)
MTDAVSSGGRKAIVAGHACLDIIPQLVHDQLAFTPGTLAEVGPATVSTGGCVSNTGLALHRLGAPVELVARIGNDDIGRMLEAALRKQGASTAGLNVSSTDHTSYSVVISPTGGDRMVLHYSGANDNFTSQDIDRALEARASLLHFGYPPLMRRMYEDGGDELACLFGKAKTAGLITSLDMAYPDPARPSGRADWAGILRRTLPCVDIFLPSYDELIRMLEADRSPGWTSTHGTSNQEPTPWTLERLSQIVLDMGAGMVAIKLGECGLYLRTSGASRLAQLGRGLSGEAWATRELWVSVFQVQVVGTVGAGDATIAGFLYAVLNEMSPESACHTACAVGGCNVEAVDALSGIRPWSQIEKRIADGWAHAKWPGHEGWTEISPGVFAGPFDGVAK